jgi:hypothetical protein
MSKKVRDSWMVVDPTGNSYHYSEAEAVAEFRQRPTALRVMRQTEALVRNHFAKEAMAFAGMPKGSWTNRDSAPPRLVVEREGTRERWPND